MRWKGGKRDAGGGGVGQVNAPGLAAAEGEADISGGRAAVARARSGDVLR